MFSKQENEICIETVNLKNLYFFNLIPIFNSRVCHFLLQVNSQQED